MVQARQRLSINLLPSESDEIKRRKRNLRAIQTISTFALLLVVFFASVIVALRILQLQSIKNAASLAKSAEERTLRVQEKETSLVKLKSRLDTISSLLEEQSKQSIYYSLAEKLLPPTVTVSSISVDRLGVVTTSVVIPDSTSLDALFLNLGNEVVYDSLAKIELESLSRSRDGFFRANLKMVPKT